MQVRLCSDSGHADVIKLISSTVPHPLLPSTLLAFIQGKGFSSQFFVASTIPDASCSMTTGLSLVEDSQKQRQWPASNCCSDRHHQSSTDPGNSAVTLASSNVASICTVSCSSFLARTELGFFLNLILCPHFSADADDSLGRRQRSYSY
jgi:hypothetical protein